MVHFTCVFYSVFGNGFKTKKKRKNCTLAREKTNYTKCGGFFVKYRYLLIFFVVLALSR